MAASLLAAMTVTLAHADDFSQQSPFFARLSAPMTSIVDGKPFRDGVESIAKQAQLNLWMDRLVDPTAPIMAGPVRPTVFGAIEKLAATRDCVVMPVANVLLVGRPQWVDQTAASILSLQPTRNASLADISWNDLTTPDEAISLAAGGGTRVEVSPPLPHDLWPATTWQQIDRRVAVVLVLAQFDRRPRSTKSLGTIASLAATTSGPFTRRYSLGKVSSAIRIAMSEVDRRSRFRVEDGWIEGTSSIAAHRAAVATILHQSAKAAAPDPDRDTFTLKKMSTTAENALMQLAKSAQKMCVIEAGASDACQAIISIEGEDVTLRKLIDMVATQAGVVAQWKDDSIVISREK